MRPYTDETQPLDARDVPETTHHPIVSIDWDVLGDLLITVRPFVVAFGAGVLVGAYLVLRYLVPGGLAYFLGALVTLLALLLAGDYARRGGQP